MVRAPRWHRYKVASLLFAAYTGFFFCRRSLSSSTYSILNAEAQLFNVETISSCSTAYALAYGLSKLLIWVVDYIRPRYVLAGGLVVTGLFNVGISQLTWAPLLAIIWFLNGLVQGLGWPAVAVIIEATFVEPAERAMWWSLISVSQNFGSACTPIFVKWIISPGAMTDVLPGYLLTPAEPWRMAFLTLGLLAICMSGVVMVLLPDVSAQGTASGGKGKLSGFTPKEVAPRRWAAFWHNITGLSMTTFSLVLGSLLLYLVRGAFLDWATMLLVSKKGMDPLEVPDVLALFEVVGIVGSITAGYISDRFFRGTRGPVMVGYTAGMVLSCLCLWASRGGFFVRVATGCLGFSLFGPQTLYGLWGREVSPPRHRNLVSAALGMGGQAGSALAGYPLMLLRRRFGWNVVFHTMTISSCTLLLIMWTQRKVVPRKADQKEE